ncbi:B-type cyclin [Coemansia erecta]|nr:B-type cyclin [Coemansia erecta]KAJ2874857.1 B-type cyclin [Coemansia asiatica]
MFQNKSSTMPLRSRIPGRAGITDENKMGTRGSKETEPAGKSALITKQRGALIMPTTAATIGVKAGVSVTVKSFGASVASTDSRSRTALSNVVNLKTQAVSSKIAKPSDAATKVSVRPLTKSARAPINSSSHANATVSATASSAIAKPTTLGTARGRQTASAINSGIARPTTMSARSTNQVANRPISKPSATFGARRPRAVVATAAAAVVAVSSSAKRPRYSESENSEANAALGKHTRSGRITRPIATRSASDMSVGSGMESSSEENAIASMTDATSAGESGSTTAVGSCVGGSESMQISTSPVIPDMVDSSPVLDGLGELKFVETDTIDYALSHTGLLNEHPIRMTEINEFEADVDPSDMTLVPEFSDDIFGYMRELEIKQMPDPKYISRQPSLTWSTRTILVEWLVQVHKQFNLLPETLYLAVNFVDRFLSTKEIVINKLQLVGAVCLLLASKYEEIHVPSVKDIEYMVEKNYSEEDILRAERFILRMLNFDLGWPGPLSFLRRISKADDYDMATRTLAKYIIEVTLIDERFISIPCSKVAAASHYLALRFLDKGNWTRAHAFYSGYFESELLPVARILIELLMQPRKFRAIYEKYAERKFLRASEYVYQWFKVNSPELLLIPTNGDHAPTDLSIGEKEI